MLDATSDYAEKWYVVAIFTNGTKNMWNFKINADVQEWSTRGPGALYRAQEYH